MCGTEKFPEKFKAKKYKLHDHFIDKKNFHHMMTNLPEQVIIKLAFCILLSLHCIIIRLVKMILKKCSNLQIRTKMEK